jgi:hypothetical protein
VNPLIAPPDVGNGGAAIAWLEKRDHETMPVVGNGGALLLGWKNATRGGFGREGKGHYD